jgi:hypothetical protein
MRIPMERPAKGDVVRFAGPVRSGGYWPKQEELGLVEDADDEIVVVVWELAGGPAAWPVAWIVKVPVADIEE